jgi:hypothetical protein
MPVITAGKNEIRIKPLQLILIVALLQFIIAFFTDPMIFSFDESMWHYIGRNWFRNGLPPYAGGIDNKSPLIFFIFGISDWLFGVNYWFPRLFGIFVQSAGIYYLFKIAERTISPKAGLFAISFYGLSLLWRSTGGKYVSYTETYAIGFLIISIYFGLVCQNKKQAFAGGLLAGLGLGFRFSAAFGILPLFIFIFRKNRKSAFVFLLGLLTSIGLLVLFAAMAGIRINEFLFYGFADNFGAGSPTAHSLAWKAQQFANGFFYSELILFYPALCFYFILNRKTDFLKAWFISEFIGIMIVGIYDRVHFRDLLPAMSLMSAFAVNYLMENHHAPAKQILLGIWIVFFPKTFEPLFAAKKLFISRNKQSMPDSITARLEDEGWKRKIGLWIRSKTFPNEKVYVAGYGAQIQVYSERVSPSVYFNVTQTPFAKKRLFSDLSSDKPAMMLIPLSEGYSSAVDTDVRLFINELAAKNYRFDTCMYNYNIFRYSKTDSAHSNNN